MNFDDAIRAHSAWKMKLSNYIAKPDKSLRPEEVCLDDRCDLGKWIHGEAKKYEAEGEYKTLRTEHARFHRAAADVVRKVDLGQSVSEDVQIGSASEFAKASSSVVSAIMQMKSKLS